MKRFTFRTVLYILLDALLLIACFVHIPNVVRRPSAPFDVERQRTSVVISAILDSAACPGVKPGDALLTWQGNKVAMPEMVEYLADTAPIGAQIQLGMQRGETVFPANARLIAYYKPSEFLILSRFLIISLFVGLSIFAVGVFVLLSRPNDLAARALHWALITFGTTTLITWGAVDPASLESSLARVVWFISYLGVAVSFFVFSLVFPRERFQRLGQYSWLLLVAVVALGIAFASSHLTALSSGSAEAFIAFQSYFDFFHIALLILVGGGIFNIARATLTASSSEERRKMYWILWGLAIGALPFLLLHILPQVVLSEYLIPEEFTTIFFLAVPTSFAIAVLKYRLFDIEVVINRTIVYGVLSTFIVAGYALIVLLMTSIIGEIVFEHYLLVAGLTLGIGLAVNPLRLWLQHIIDETLFAARANYRRALSGAVEKLHRSLNRAELFQKLIDAVHAVVPGERIVVYEKEHARLVLRAVWGTSPPEAVPLDEEFAAALVASESLVSARGADGHQVVLDPRREKWLSDLQWSVCVPFVSAAKELLGVLVLNPRPGEGYKEEEVMFVKSVSAQVAEMLERLILQEEIILAQEERRRLEELSALKSFFVSSVSHELRTPLTSIVIFAEMLRSGTIKSRQQQREYLEIIEGESNRLSRLITNILDFAKIERGIKEYNFSETKVEDVVKRTVQAIRYQFLAREASLHVRVEKGLPTMVADADALEEAILNLLSNALKYSTTIRKVALTVGKFRGNIRIVVSDRGIGISEQELPHIFDQFYRVRDERTRQVGGAGLGLAVVKHIVDAHHGTLKVKSIVGRGTTFTLQLPVTPKNKRKHP
jgi:signal transduction histidine kinase